MKIKGEMEVIIQAWMIMRKRKWKVHMGIPMGISVLCIMFYIMQWNARSPIANGQEFKHMLDGLEEKQK